MFYPFLFTISALLHTSRLLPGQQMSQNKGDTEQLRTNGTIVVHLCIPCPKCLADGQPYPLIAFRSSFVSAVCLEVHHKSARTEFLPNLYLIVIIVRRQCITLSDHVGDTCTLGWRRSSLLCVSIPTQRQYLSNMSSTPCSVIFPIAPGC